jgi:hypothetical protein
LNFGAKKYPLFFDLIDSFESGLRPQLRHVSPFLCPFGRLSESAFPAPNRSAARIDADTIRLKHV